MKRGVVITGGNIRSMSDGLEESPGIASLDLRFYLMYFDMIDRPTNNVINVRPSADEQYLASCGVLTHTRVIFTGSFTFGAEIMITAHEKAHAIRSSAQGELWTKGLSGVQFIQPNPEQAVKTVIEMSLYQALPCAAEDVPFDEILEFKHRRHSELLALRAHLDEVYESIISSQDILRANSAALVRLEQALSDLSNAVKPSFATRVVNGLKIQIDPISLAGFAMAGAAAASSAGVPIALGAGLGAAVSMVKFELAKAPVASSTPTNLKDFSYVVDVNSNFKK